MMRIYETVVLTQSMIREVFAAAYGGLPIGGGRVDLTNDEAITIVKGLQKMAAAVFSGCPPLCLCCDHEFSPTSPAPSGLAYTIETGLTPDRGRMQLSAICKTCMSLPVASLDKRVEMVLKNSDPDIRFLPPVTERETTAATN